MVSWSCSVGFALSTLQQDPVEVDSVQESLHILLVWAVDASHVGLSENCRHFVGEVVAEGDN